MSDILRESAQKWVYINAILSFDVNNIMEIIKCLDDDKQTGVVERFIDEKDDKYEWSKDKLNKADVSLSDLSLAYMKCKVMIFSDTMLYEAMRDAIPYIEKGVYPYTKDNVKVMSDDTLLATYIYRYGAK